MTGRDYVTLYAVLIGIAATATGHSELGASLLAFGFVMEFFRPTGGNSQ